MTALVLVAAVVAALDPAGRGLRLHGLDRRRAVVAAGATLAVVAAIAAASGPVLDAGDVSTPTTRVAAGLVLAAVGVRDLVRRPPGPLVLPPGDGAALVPAAFPVLLEPQVGVLALAAGASSGVGPTVAAGALALVVWLAARRLRPAVLVPAVRLVATTGVLAGVALVADGVVSV